MNNQLITCDIQRMIIEMVLKWLSVCSLQQNVKFNVQFLNFQGTIPTLERDAASSL